MELEEMKTLWKEMSMDMEKQKKLTDSLIIKMTNSNYRNKITKVLIPEVIGSLVCFAGILFILINLQKLDKWYLLVCGIVSSLILFILPTLSIKTILGIRSVNISGNNYKQSLLEYSKRKIKFVSVQKLSFCLGAVLMLTILPVMGKLIGGTDFFKVTSIWFWYIIAFPFFYALSRWVFKSYNKITSEAENILKELEY